MGLQSEKTWVSLDCTCILCNIIIIIVISILDLAGNNDIHKSLNEIKFGEIRPWTKQLAALERLKKIP